MKALVVTEQHALELREVPDPTPGPYDALVQIRACAVCSTTDREIVKGIQPYHSTYPCILGHEAVGEVIETGAKVTHLKKGDFVTRPAGILPGQSRDGLASGWGGFSELGTVCDRKALEADGDTKVQYDYTALRQNVVPTESGEVDIAQAVLSISLAETASWIRHLGQLGGKRVCVSGTGIAGLSCAIWAKLAGAKCVTVLGRRKTRLDLARDLAADCVVNVKEVDDVATAIRDVNHGGVDVYCEAVGQKDQMRIAMKSVNDGGTIAIYGVVPGGTYDIDSSDFRSNITVITPPGDEHLAYDWALDMQRRGIVPTEKLMTHRWPLVEFARAFEQIAAGEVVKGMLEM